jgi:hypothetical protein
VREGGSFSQSLELDSCCLTNLEGSSLDRAVVCFFRVCLMMMCDKDKTLAIVTSTKEKGSNAKEAEIYF